MHDAAALSHGASELARHWSLDPDITYLNHGSYGACPRPVLAVQQALRDQLEREPARFFLREAARLLRGALEELARFVGAPVSRLAFVPNVTTAINSVLRSIPLPAGAELLVTGHEYNATRNILEYVAAERGCRVVVAEIPFPITGPEAVLEAVLARVTARTKLAVIDQARCDQPRRERPGSALEALRHRVLLDRHERLAKRLHSGAWGMSCTPLHRAFRAAARSPARSGMRETLVPRLRTGFESSSRGKLKAGPDRGSLARANLRSLS